MTPNRSMWGSCCCCCPEIHPRSQEHCSFFLFLLLSFLLVTSSTFVQAAEPAALQQITPGSFPPRLLPVSPSSKKTEKSFHRQGKLSPKLVSVWQGADESCNGPLSDDSRSQLVFQKRQLRGHGHFAQRAHLNVGLVLSPLYKKEFFLHKITPQNKHLVTKVYDGWLSRKPLHTTGMFQ